MKFKGALGMSNHWRLLTVIFALGLVSLGSVLVAFATHTNASTVSPTPAKGSTNITFTVTVTNNAGGDDVNKVIITRPTNYTGATCGAAPASWSLDSYSVTQCTYITSTASAYIVNGTSKAFTFSTVTPGSSGSDTWQVQTQDIKLGADSQNPSVTIDATAPTLQHANITSGNNITLFYSEAVNTTATDYENLTVVGAAKTLASISGSGTSTITLILNGGAVAANATGRINISATVIDTVGNALTPLQGYTIGDGQAPTVSSVTSVSANGNYNLSKTISVTAVFSEPVTVTGTPDLELNTGSTYRNATYTNGTGTTQINFTYTVQAGDTSSDLDYTGTGALTLNGGSIVDLNSNAAVLTLAAPGAAGSLGANKDIVIDTTAPAITATSPHAGMMLNAQQVSFTLSEAVASATIVFTKQSGTDAGSPHTCAIQGTNLTSGAHTAVPMDAANCAAWAAPLLNGINYTVTFDATDLVGNAATQVSNAGVTYDTGAPTVSSVSSDNADGYYNLSKLIDIKVTFSENVNVTGAPVLQLETGTTDHHAYYQNGTGTTVLHFLYTVTAGDTSARLNYTAINALSLNSTATIKDVAGNAATLTLPADDSLNKLSALKNIVIDTTAPAISATAPASSSSIQDQAVNYTLSEAVASGVIVFTRTGGTADAVVHNCTLQGTALTGTAHTNLTLAQDANACTEAWVSLVNGAVYTVTFDATDAAANAATRVTNTAVTYDRTAPTLNSIAWNDTDSSTAINGGDTLALTFSEPIADSTIRTDTKGHLDTDLGIDNGHTLDTTTAVWSGSNTVLTVTLGASTTVVSGDTLDPASTVTDIAGNKDATPSPVAIVDNASPVAQSATLNMNTGHFVLTFSKAVNTSSLNPTGITIQDNATATSSYTLTGGTTSSNNGTTIDVTLAAADLKALKLNPNIAHAQANSYFRLTAATIKDMYNNAVTAIADGSAVQVSSFTADTTAPTLSSWTINMNTGLMNLTFSEPVQVGTFDSTKFTLQDDGSATHAVALSGTYTAGTYGSLSAGQYAIGGTSNVTLQIMLSAANLKSVKADGNITKALATSYIQIAGSSGVNDTAATSNALSAMGTGTEAGVFTADSTAPTLSSWTLNINTGLVTINFSEPITDNTINLTEVTIQNAATAGSSATLAGTYTAGTGTTTGKYDITGTNAVQLRFNLTTADLNTIKALSNVGKAASNSYIRIAASNGIRDYTTNDLAAIADGSAVQVSTFTADSTAPTLNSWTLNMNAGTMALTFSEPMNTSTLNATGFTIQDAATKNLASVTLTGGMTSSANGTAITVTLAAADLNSIKVNRYLARATGSSYILTTTASMKDMANNAVTAIADTAGLGAGSYTADTTAPTVSSMYPANATTTAATTVNPYIIFGEGVDDSTVTNLTVQLYKYSDDTAVQASVTVADGYTKAIIRPDTALAAGVQYYVVVTSGVKDMFGNAVSSTWSSSNKADHQFTVLSNSNYTQSLVTGWNTLWIPPQTIMESSGRTAGSTGNFNFTSILSSLGANWNYMYYNINGTSTGWVLATRTDFTGSTLKYVNNTNDKPYWVNMTADATFVI